MIDPRFDTKCFVDSLAPGQWEVTVWNRLDPPDRRVYVLGAVSDDAAAEAGMNLFDEDMRGLQAGAESA